jgi:hypothetical protein
MRSLLLDDMKLLEGNLLGKGVYISGHGALHIALQGLQFAVISISHVQIT